jgi:ribonuclease VapC
VIAVDASAIVAILQREAGCEALVAALKAADGAATSAIGVFEATLAVRRILGCSTATAERLITDFLSVSHIQVLPLPAGIAQDALAAFDRYGKGTGHPAKLNLGDCFAYAQARQLGAALLFVGNDFGRTDVTPATQG